MGNSNSQPVENSPKLTVKRAIEAEEAKRSVERVNDLTAILGIAVVGIVTALLMVCMSLFFFAVFMIMAFMFLLLLGLMFLFTIMLLPLSLLCAPFGILGPLNFCSNLFMLITFGLFDCC